MSGLTGASSLKLSAKFFNSLNSEGRVLGIDGTLSEIGCGLTGVWCGPCTTAN